MANNIDNSESYINPYNFISLNKNGCKRKDKDEYSGDLTGYIECTLTTKTETMIPDTRPDKIKEKTISNGVCPEYIFFSYDENIPGTNIISPVIPGSELRGMIRSDFETFTDSCLSTINIDKSFISRTPEIKKPGILEKDKDGNWHLYEATRYSLHTTRHGKNMPPASPSIKNKEAVYMVNDKNQITYSENQNVLPKDIKKDLKTGDRVSFISMDKQTGVKEISNKGLKTGILFIGETGGKKVERNIHDGIFVKVNKEVKANNLNESVKKLKEIYDVYNDPAFNKANVNEKVWYCGYDFEQLSQLPVWYSDKIDKEKGTYLSLSAIGKEAYHRTISELLNVTGNISESYIPCVDKANLCPTCAIFGFISNDSALGSKLRFSDAIYIGNENPYSNKRLIQELAIPHIANSAFYALYLTNRDLLNMKDNVDWNYDFLFSKNRPRTTIDEIYIRGRKNYWHHKPDPSPIGIEETVRNCRITPIKEGSTFKFKIYFENMNKKYLDKLISVINMDYESDIKINGKPYYDLCHKIGRAKPLGYGSVKLHVENVKIREFNIEDNGFSYEMKDYELMDNEIVINEQFKENMNTETMKDALRIYNFNYMSANYPECKITYPLSTHMVRGQATLAGHFWFMDNKSNKLRDPYILMVLPKISEGSEKPLGIEGLNERQKRVINRNGKDVKISGLRLPKYKKI